VSGADTAHSGIYRTDNHYTALELVKPRARTTIKREDSAAHHSRLRSSSSGSPQRSLDGLDEDEELTESDGDDYQRHHRYSSHFRPVKKYAYDLNQLSGG